MTLTIKFGCVNQVTVERPEGTTVGAIKRDSNLKAVLGFGEAVDAIVDDHVQPDTTTLADGDTVELVTSVTSKR